MKRITQIIGFGLLMSIASLSFAQTKVAVFNAQAAILGSDQAKATLEKLRNDSNYAGLQAELETLKSDMEALRKESETKGMTWSADQVAEHRKKMESVGSDLQYTAKKMQSEQQSVMQRIMQQMQPKVEEALTAVIKAEGVDLVLDSQAAFFASDAADITDLVTQRLNK
jgi:outer membrane protein